MSRTAKLMRSCGGLEARELDDALATFGEVLQRRTWPRARRTRRWTLASPMPAATEDLDDVARIVPGVHVSGEPAPSRTHDERLFQRAGLFVVATLGRQRRPRRRRDATIVLVEAAEQAQILEAHVGLLAKLDFE